MRIWLAFAILTATATAQQPYRIVREGASFVRISQGTIPAPSAGSVRIVTHGRVHVQGESRSNIRYQFKLRTHARDFEEASRLLAGVSVEWADHGPLRIIHFRSVSPGAVTSEVSLQIPRDLPDVHLEVDDGMVSALDLDGFVTATARSGAILLDRIAKSVVASTGGGEMRLGTIGGRIRCTSGGGGIFVDTAGAEATLQTAGGEVVVRHALGPVSISSGGGNVQVVRAESVVTAYTNGGLVEVGRALGGVQAQTAGGAIEIGAASGVQCQSAAGAIRLREISGEIRASALMGSIVAELARHGFSDSFLDAKSGDITVRIPSTLAVTVQAESDAAGRLGKILSDFPEIGARNTIWAFGSPLRAQGAINGGGPLLRLSAAGGVIYLKRQE
jgi:hypothetical protein